MKIPLSDQIEAATRHRDRLQEAVGVGAPADLHAAEATVLTLTLLKTYEAPFRQFMAQRAKERT